MADYDAQPGRTHASAEAELSQAQLEADEHRPVRRAEGGGRLVAGARGSANRSATWPSSRCKAIPGVDGAGVTLVESLGRHPAHPNMGCHGGIHA